MNRPCAKAHGSCSSSSRCHRESFLPEAPALTAMLSKPMGRARRKRVARASSGRRDVRMGFDKPVAAFVVASGTGTTRTRDTPPPLPCSGWASSRSSYSRPAPRLRRLNHLAGLARHRGTTPEARVLPRLVTTRHGPVHVASGQTDRPRASHRICPGLPPRHSHRARGLARFQPTNREDRLTHGCWLSQFGFVSWSTHRQALYAPFMVELFAPRLRAHASCALPRVPGCGHRHPEAVLADVLAPHAGQGCTDGSKALRPGFRSAPPGRIWRPRLLAPHLLRLVRPAPRDLRGCGLFSVAPVPARGGRYRYGIERWDWLVCRRTVLHGRSVRSRL